MKRIDARAIVGLALIAAGILFLLQTFGLIPADLPLLWVGAFGIGGLIFLYVFLVNPSDWWALIPGFSLLGIAGLIGLSALLPELGDNWGAAFFLAMIGLSFWIIYLATKFVNWWAIIPGGSLLSVAALIAFEPLMGESAAGILLLGLAVTFGLVYLLPKPVGRLRWALIPAGVLLLIGLLLSATAVEALKYVWPLALLLGGGYLMWISLRRE